MKIDTYHRKLDAILDLLQFEKVGKGRKNAKHPEEEERVVGILQTLKAVGHIDDKLHRKLKPKGSLPARLYDRFYRCPALHTTKLVSKSQSGCPWYQNVRSIHQQKQSKTCSRTTNLMKTPKWSASTCLPCTPMSQ